MTFNRAKMNTRLNDYLTNQYKGEDDYKVVLRFFFDYCKVNPDTKQAVMTLHGNRKHKYTVLSAINSLYDNFSQNNNNKIADILTAIKTELDGKEPQETVDPTGDLWGYITTVQGRFSLNTIPNVDALNNSNNNEVTAIVAELSDETRRKDIKHIARLCYYDGTDITDPEFKTILTKLANCTPKTVRTILDDIMFAKRQGCSLDPGCIILNLLLPNNLAKDDDLKDCFEDLKDYFENFEEIRRKLAKKAKKANNNNNNSKTQQNTLFNTLTMLLKFCLLSPRDESESFVDNFITELNSEHLTKAMLAENKGRIFAYRKNRMNFFEQPDKKTFITDAINDLENTLEVDLIALITADNVQTLLQNVSRAGFGNILRSKGSLALFSRGARAVTLAVVVAPFAFLDAVTEGDGLGVLFSNVGNQLKGFYTHIAHLAAEYGSLSILQYAIHSGFDVEQKCTRGCNVYEYALKKEQIHILKFLKDVYPNLEPYTESELRWYPNRYKVKKDDYRKSFGTFIEKACTTDIDLLDTMLDHHTPKYYSHNVKKYLFNKWVEYPQLLEMILEKYLKKFGNVDYNNEITACIKLINGFRPQYRYQSNVLETLSEPKKLKGDAKTALTTIQNAKFGNSQLFTDSTIEKIKTAKKLNNALTTLEDNIIYSYLKDNITSKGETKLLKMLQVIEGLLEAHTRFGMFSKLADVESTLEKILTEVIPENANNNNNISLN